VVDSDSSVALYAAVVGASLVVVVASFLWVLTKRRQSKEMTMAKEHIMQAKMASSVTSNSNNNEDAIEFCADRNAVDFCDDEAA
jgi:mannitol-specific phosphotransferase system IIBC component